MSALQTILDAANASTAATQANTQAVADLKTAIANIEQLDPANAQAIADQLNATTTQQTANTADVETIVKQLTPATPVVEPVTPIIPDPNAPA